MNFIPLSRPNIIEKDIDAVKRVLESGMLVQGREVAALEKKIASYLGVGNAIASSNGTSSLHLALIALGVGPGNEVIIPAFSYIATANVVELVGAKPVFVDVELDTCNINVGKIEEAITPNTKAIIPVHEFGLACDISAIADIANRHQLHVIEDAACALGAMEHNKFVGSFGDFGSFSFHPRKNITSGEGGMITTDNDNLADKVRILRNHGIGSWNGKSAFLEAGFNYRLTDIQAALVGSQFERFDATLKKKSELAHMYLDFLSDTDAIHLPLIPENKNHTWQTFHIRLNKTLDRDEVIRYLAENNIGTNYGAQCIPFQKYYEDKYHLDCDTDFPNALSLFKSGLALPLFETLKEEDIKNVANILKRYILKAEK